MLHVQNISFSYQDREVISAISFDAKKGQCIAIIGESGCGKSTLLKLVYGLYDLDNGEISWNNSAVLGPKYNLIPGMDFMKYLAQNFDLMPFITVAENVGKYISNIYQDKKKQRIAELLEIVEMTAYANVKAQFLSGGQMQRVAIARVLALEPEVLLLDEPFSHIDNFRKNSLRRKLFSYLKEKQITCIVATHDSTDVLSFSDEVMVMKKGEIIEKGNPQIIYSHPKSRYIASLFGDVNEIEFEGKINYLFPHQLKIVAESGVKATVMDCYYRGSDYLVVAKNEKQTFFVEHTTSLSVGLDVYINKIDL
jgi:ABC-type Fe3+/spermidine/putrescine transport system ATPase subunit